jgi:hypothetical protein
MFVRRSESNPAALLMLQIGDCTDWLRVNEIAIDRRLPLIDAANCSAFIDLSYLQS